MSAYRTAPEQGPAFALLCPTCGARQIVREAQYRCSKCKREQPLRPETSPAVTNLVLVHGEKLVDADKARRDAPQIQPLAASLGVMAEGEGAGDVLVVSSDGVEIRVWVRTDSGSPVGLVFTAEVESSLTVTFLRESDDHRTAKDDGLTVEVQTGDAEFDRQVFVDTTAPAADVLAFLATKAVRRALETLLVEADSVEVGAHATKLEIGEREPVDAVRAKRVLAALRTVVGAARPVQAGPAVVPKALGPLTAASPLGFVAGVGLIVFGAGNYTPLTFGPVLTGGLLGLILGQLPVPFLRRALAGSSRSHLYLASARGITTVQGVLLGIGLVLTLNGALDRSPARAVTLRGVETRYDDEDHKTTVEIETKEPGLEGRHSFHFEDRGKAIHLPAVVHLTYRRGYFGYPWRVGAEQLEMIK